MRPDEIDTRCHEVATRTGLLPEWVKHYVLKKAGSPCRRCDGTGFSRQKVCPQCEGTGGRASHSSVTHALLWVESHIELVRRNSMKREASSQEQQAQIQMEKALAVVHWKQEHRVLWDFLDDMLPCEFKYALIDAVEDARVTERQMEVLTQMEESSRRAPAPKIGAIVHVPVRITSAVHSLGFQGKPIFRIDFWHKSGWGGRLETQDENLITQIQARTQDECELQGVVTWSKDSYAIFSGRVSVNFQSL